MATIKYERIRTPVDGQIKLFRWPNMAEGDVGQPVLAATFNDKTVRVAGDFGSDGQVIAEGTLIPGTEADDDFDQLVDPHDSPISWGVKDTVTVLQNVYLFRPKVPAGTGVDVTVYLLVR